MRHGTCARCGGPYKGRAVRRQSPVAYCARCHDPVCDKHVRWGGDDWICCKCEKAT